MDNLSGDIYLFVIYFFSCILFRSFMVDSGDSDLIHQKLTMSQYIAYRSEPLGQLGDSSFQERVGDKI